MGYRVEKNKKIREAKNKKIKHKSLLIAIVFIISIISNSITQNTFFAAVNENKKFIIDNVLANDKVNSDDNIFEVTRSAEKIGDNEVKISLDIKVNNDNTPNENVQVEAEEGQDIILQEEAIKGINITEALNEGFSLVNDSIKFEEVKENESINLTDLLKNDEYSDLSMNRLENKLNITVKNSSYTEFKISYSVTINSNINSLENAELFSESALKYKLIEDDEEKNIVSPNALVTVKEVVLESENDEIPPTEEEVSNEVKQNTITTDNIVLNETSTQSITGVFSTVNVNWSRTPEPSGNSNPFLDITKTIYYKDTSTNSYIVNGKGYMDFTTGRVLVAPTTMYDGGSMKKGTFDYNTLTEILNPTQTTNVWNSNNGKGATWNHYTANNVQCDSWRLFRGEFTVEDLRNKKFYIGILDDNGEPSLIVPINDHMIVLVDGEPIGVNYTTQNKTTTNMKNFSLSFGEEIYNPIFANAYRKTPNPCGEESHYTQSSNTDGWHIHLDDVSKENEKGILGDITSYLKSDLKTHTVEILFGDNSGTGGASKVEVFEVDASIDVQKAAYSSIEFSDTTKINDGTIKKGTDIYYEFKMTNTSTVAMDSASFLDEFLNVKIDSTGIYKKNSNGEFSNDGVLLDGLTIIRENITKSGSEALTLLTNIPAGTTITIKDINNLKYETKDRSEESFNVDNTVEGTGKFLKGKLPVVEKATASVKVVETIVDDSINIEKSIYKINGKDPASALIIPGDKVSFKFVITNKNDFAVSNLNITDELSSPYEAPEWTFTCSDIANFNASNFTLLPKQSITIITSEWEVPIPGEKEKDSSGNETANFKPWDYNVKNTVTLNKGEKKLGESSIDLQIEGASLKIKKVISGESLSDPKQGRTFTIMIKGSDGTQYNIEAEANEEYTLNNLKYGVTYNVSEIVPMNYELVSISGDDVTDGNIILTGTNNGTLVTVRNKRVNDTFFTSENGVTNIFEFIKGTFGYKDKEVK